MKRWFRSTNPNVAPHTQATLPGRVTSASRVRHLVLLWLCLLAAVSYMQRSCITVVDPLIRADLGLSRFELGLAMGVFSAAYALLQIPTGWLGDRLGSRLVLPLYMLVSSAGTALTSISGGVVGLIASRQIKGCGQAGLFPCAASTITQWLPVSRRAYASGLFGAFMQFGAGFASVLTAWLLAQGMGWRWVFVVFALPGVVWAIGFYAWFRDRPEDHRGVNEPELAIIRAGKPPENNIAANGGAPRTPWRAFVTHPSFVAVCIQQFFRGAGNIFFTSWFATFLMETRGISLPAAGTLASLPLWSLGIGSLLAGAWSDWILVRTKSRNESRRHLAIGSSLACAAVVWYSTAISDPTIAVLVISLGTFLASFAGPVSYASTMDLGGKHVATAFGMMNMCGNFGAMLFPVVAGWIRDRTGSWDTVMVLFVIIHVAAAVCWLFVRFNRTLDGTPLDVPATGAEPGSLNR